MKTICISGGFDPIHIGHLDYIEHSAVFGSITVILNSDSWLIRKKGYCFMPFEERKRILHHIRGVKEVVAVDDSDGSVCEALKRIKPNFFANGGDRTSENTLELEMCNELGIVPLFNIGGGKTASSSELAKRAKKMIFI